jgi:hypothetical protein
MYIGRSLRFNKVVPICAIEADRLSGVTAPLILKLVFTDVGCQTVFSGHFTAREKALVFFELEAGWALELAWMFWRKDSSLASSKI